MSKLEDSDYDDIYKAQNNQESSTIYKVYVTS